jgi:hypothetical protein
MISRKAYNNISTFLWKAAGGLVAVGLISVVMLPEVRVMRMSVLLCLALLFALAGFIMDRSKR